MPIQRKKFLKQVKSKDHAFTWSFRVAGAGLEPATFGLWGSIFDRRLTSIGLPILAYPAVFDFKEPEVWWQSK